MMELLVRRGQKVDAGAFSNTRWFTLYVKAQLTDEEADNLNKYDMGSTLLYSNPEAAADKSVRVDGYKYPVISVQGLAEGLHVKCARIVDMMDFETKILSSSEVFKQMLDVAASFGGEEVYTFD
ncbi:hypothetical protein [Kordiimonas aestuarii]|uniref:hypothetical protein n=1 Tax=Kordiimonas aestuarii TaxID=1005925 RepID=UPI0021CF0924|nr:hypothetical protein [Kordiimonas aestuarii]